MNGYHHERELPELRDDEIRLLDSICKAASQLNQAPFKALIGQYEATFKEKGLSSERDDGIFRWLMRIGDNSRRSYSTVRPTNFVPYLRSLLESQGITVIDDEEEQEEIGGVTRSLDVEPGSARPRRDPLRRRRVSFDDADLDQTWLNERSEFTEGTPHATPRGMLKQPPRRVGDIVSYPRARSASGSDNHFGAAQPAPKHFQHPSRSSEYSTEDEGQPNQTLFMEPSHTQLELNAEAFLHTTDLRYKRRCIRALCDIVNERQRSYALASSLNRAQLLKSALSALHEISQSRRKNRVREAQLQKTLLEYHRRVKLSQLRGLFSHWQANVTYSNGAIEKAKSRAITFKYFWKWHNVTIDNIVKARSVLLRKFLRIWSNRAVREAMEHERQVALYEELLARKYLRRWQLKFRSRRVEPWKEASVERKALVKWVDKLDRLRAHETQAVDLHTTRLAQRTLRQLLDAAQARSTAAQEALNHHGRKTKSHCIQVLCIEAKLKPLAATLSLKVQFNLKRKAINAWHLHFELTRQAREIDHKRVIQSAWTSWNDALRCKVLGQRIDERVLVESLRKWILRTRLQSFTRHRADKQIQHAFATWRAKRQQKSQTLDEASAAFAESQRRRRLKFGILRLHVSVRYREDAVRAAVEFSNSRALPDVIDAWRTRTDHVRQITKWATDARFYYLSTKSLKTWRERTTEHQHARRREAYAQVRARIKIRIVRDCFAQLRNRLAVVSTMQQDAKVGYDARLFRVGTQSFDRWRERTFQHIEHDVQARNLDRQKLLASAIAVLVDGYANKQAMQQGALLLQQEADLALQASALRKAQWASFTAKRRVETADALRARNRDLHMKRMLRHWSAQATSRRLRKRQAAQQDPESPSLRPASRLASKSAERPTFDSSPPIQSATPGYLRTPSRSRKASRFRPLPTPAHVTPMTYDKSYFVTTPAPLTNSRPATSSENLGGRGDVFDGLTPQITPFARKLRASGLVAAPPSALKSSVFGRSIGTSKSVRFAGSRRFGSGSGPLSSTDE